MNDFIMSITHLADAGKLNFKRSMGLLANKGKAVEELAARLKFESLYHMRGKVLSIGTLGMCSWSDDFGEDLSVLATVLNVKVLVFEKYTVAKMGLLTLDLNCHLICA